MVILDTNHDDKLVCDKELNALSLDTLKTLANILDGDSGNTEDHEFFSFTPDAIRYMYIHSGPMFDSFVDS